MNSSFLSGQGTEQMIPDTFSSSLLLALGFANQVHCHATATGAALRSDWRRSSFCRRSTQLQGKNYCCKPFRTSQGERNPRQSLRMHSKHPQPTLRTEFFTLKSLGHWKSVRFFFHCLSSSGIKNYVFGSRASMRSCKMIFISSSQTICSLHSTFKGGDVGH